MRGPAVAGDVSSIGTSIGTYRALARTSSVKGGAGASASAEDGTGGAATGSAATTTDKTAVQQQVQKLKQTDTNVRQHEAAHQAAGGAHAGSASFTYTRGPDGKTYATAGEVQVDISAASEPAQTIAKMEQVKAAALAPADPSPQDLRVAAQADAQKLKAQSEMRNGGGSAASGASGGAGAEGGAGGTASRALAARGSAAYGSAQALGAPTRAATGLVV